MTPDDLRRLAGDPALLEVARKAIEDVLIEYREARLSMFMRNNGLVVREKNGDSSSIIRLGPEDAVRIGLFAIANHLDSETVDIAPVSRWCSRHPEAPCRDFGGTWRCSECGEVVGQREVQNG